MIQELTNKVWKVISGDRMRANMMTLCKYSRYPVTEEFSRAAHTCADILRRDGLDAEVLEYRKPAGQCYHTDMHPLGWEIREAWCELLFDNRRRIADYAGMAMSVMERSGPCPEGEYEVVLLDKGRDEASYEGVDLAGKIVCHPYGGFNWVYDRGAIGCIAVDDCGPGREDVVGWTSKGRKAVPNESFGFTVSRVVGDDLTAKLRALRDKGEKAMVRCKVDCSFREMPVENVTAFIPGETEEEVLIVAHLCHPQGSCNDNLSGCIAGMEIMRAVKRLLELGLIKPLKRGIRLLLVPEMLGSAAFISTAEKQQLDRIVAGINLDMVGATQNDHNGPIAVTEPPHGGPNFSAALCSAILKVLKEDDRDTGRYGYRTLYNAYLMEFHGGSDHIFFGDPNLKIPMPMVGQMPDKYYHTSGDTPDCIDYYIMAKNAALAAVYALTMSDLTRQDAEAVGLEIQERLIDRISFAARKSLAGDFGKDDYNARMEELDYFYGGMYDSFCEFFTAPEDDEWLKKFVATGKEQVRNAVKTFGAFAYGEEPEFPGYALRGGKWDKIPRRIGFGASRGLEGYAPTVPGGKEILDYYEKNGRDGMRSHSERQLEYFINGKNTCGEIVEMAYREVYGWVPRESFMALIECFVQLGLAEYIN